MATSTGLQAIGVSAALSPVGLVLAGAQSNWYPPEFFLPSPCNIFDQAKLPCCVSCAVATCMEALNPSWDALSPLFHFYMCNWIRQGGAPTYFEDVTLDDGLDVLTNQGICLLRYYDVPFTDTDAGARMPPSTQAIEDGQAHSLPYNGERGLWGFSHLSDNSRINGWKRILLGKQPILVGLYLTAGYGKNMARLEGGSDGSRPHAVPVLGYREADRAFLVQDCQGADFAMNGRWWLPYEEVESNTVEYAYALGYSPRDVDEGVGA
jgi:hypothetical protein